MIPIFPDYVFIDDSTLTKKIMNNVIRSEMEVGPQKTRPRQSTPMIQITFTATVCDTKLQDWFDWFSDDIAYGAKWFRMNNPYIGGKERFRFVETEINWTKLGSLHTANFTLEAY